MRDHHAGRGARERIQVEADVAFSQWHRTYFGSIHRLFFPFLLASFPLLPFLIRPFCLLPDVALSRVHRSATSSVAQSSASQSSSSVFRDPSQDGSSPLSSAATRSAISIVRRTTWHLAQGSSSSCLHPKAVANQSRRMCMISRAKVLPLRCITLTTSVPFLFLLFFGTLLRDTRG
jgi:hypothetical protein